jgi:hypothetical protein
MIEDLRRTDHIALCELPEASVSKPKLVEKVARRYGKSAAYLRWQAQALGLAF